MKLYEYVLDGDYSTRGYVVAENAQEAVKKINAQDESFDDPERITRLELIAFTGGTNSLLV